jgi:ubiquinone/menaquinone biosynthesis C-methylase UbiE
MNTLAHKMNEQFAEQAFSRQSGIFDEIYSTDTIVNYKRGRVRSHILQYLKPGSNILELNSGTGEDALFFANRGHSVHATDIATGMQQQLMKKVAANNMGHLVSNEICSFTQLHSLKRQGPYDHIFSNFAGLNCTGELYKVLAALPALLKPGGVVTLVVLPKFCLWETLLIFKGKFRTAFRRLFSKNGVKAHLEGTYFTCWYYNPSYIINHTKETFKVQAIEGLCTFVPPSYIEGFAEKHPRVYNKLSDLENKFKHRRPWRSIGDYYIISLKKK